MALHGIKMERGQDNEMRFALHTSMSDCPFVYPTITYPNYPKMAGERQCKKRQSRDKRTVVIGVMNMALLLLTLSLLSEEQRSE